MLLSQLTAMIEHYQSYHGAANLYSQQLTINQVFKASETSCYPVTLHAYLDKVVSVSVKDEAIAEKLANAGYFVLLSKSRMTSEQVLSHSRDKIQVEKSFMNLKDHLNMRRLRESSEQGLKGKIFIQYLALY